jgi:hypothetical protein
MGAVKDTVHNLVQMLDSGAEEAKSWADTMHELHSYLEAESKTVIHESLDRLLTTVRTAVAKRIGGSVVILVSPEERVTVDVSYSDEESDPRLRRLKSQGFSILTLPRFSYFIQQLKSEVAQGNLIPGVIEFLRANTKFDWAPVYLPSPAVRKAEQPSESSSSSEWKLTDFLPAFPWEGPPLPRGLFKD